MLQCDDGIHDSLQGDFAGVSVPMTTGQIIKSNGSAELKRHLIELQEILHHSREWPSSAYICGHNDRVGHQSQQRNALPTLMKLAVVADSSLREDSNASIVR